MEALKLAAHVTPMGQHMQEALILKSRALLALLLVPEATAFFEDGSCCVICLRTASRVQELLTEFGPKLQSSQARIMALSLLEPFWKAQISVFTLYSRDIRSKQAPVPSASTPSPKLHSLPGSSPRVSPFEPPTRAERAQQPGASPPARGADGKLKPQPQARSRRGRSPRGVWGDLGGD